MGGLSGFANGPQMDGAERKQACTAVHRCVFFFSAPPSRLGDLHVCVVAFGNLIKMNKYINSKDSNNLNISTYHTDCKRDAIKYFNKLYIMGNDEERKTTYQDMITEITNEYNIILKNIKYDNRYNIAKLIINNIYKCNKNIFSTNTILMSVFLSIVYMIIIFFLS